MIYRERDGMALNIVREIDGDVRIRNVLISVSNKEGLESFVTGLMSSCEGVRIFSTGGTYALLQSLPGADKHLVSVSDYTGQPEMQGGLVKTLDFKIYLGLLSETYNKEHQSDLARTEAVAIDMVVVNLYPFQQTVAKQGVTPEEARTNIDIGGPCMIRAAAKNYLRVASVTDPSDYEILLADLVGRDGKIPLSMRFALMKKAFAHTAAYDAAIAAHFAGVPEPAMKSCYTIR
jgi:phosphoribosylaminoimidazolecarboxamide formyltransferase / IMP cyclohydrolase